MKNTRLQRAVLLLMVVVCAASKTYIYDEEETEAQPKKDPKWDVDPELVSVVVYLYKGLLYGLIGLTVAMGLCFSFKNNIFYRNFLVRFDSEQRDRSNTMKKTRDQNKKNIYQRSFEHSGSDSDDQDSLEGRQ